MRYIYYIILIFLILSAALGYELLRPAVPARDIAMIVNGRDITMEDFNRIRSLPSQKRKTEGESVDSLITRELLIQEAQKEGIDKEKSFRRSIQNFYEESLIKLLMDKKFGALRVSVSDSELKKYISFLGSKIMLTVFTADTFEDAEKGNFRKIQEREVDFDDLSGGMRFRISLLKEGQKTAPLEEGGKFIVLRLNKEENHQPESPDEKERESIRMMLVGQKRERMMSEWVNGLKKKAYVRIMLKRDH